jgi:excisionase family DNA binding protein
MAIDLTIEKLISISTAAKRLGVSWSSVQTLIRNGRLDAKEVPTPSGKTVLKTSLEALERCCCNFAATVESGRKRSDSKQKLTGMGL